jgi:hypothetical protein
MQNEGSWNVVEVHPTVFPRLTESKIAAEFPGRSQKSLQVSYCVNFKKRTEKFQDADVCYPPSVCDVLIILERSSSKTRSRGDGRDVAASESTDG